MLLYTVVTTNIMHPNTLSWRELTHTHTQKMGLSTQFMNMEGPVLLSEPEGETPQQQQQQQFASLHTLSDQHKKWVSGVGVGGSLGVAGEGLCQGNSAPSSKEHGKCFTVGRLRGEGGGQSDGRGRWWASAGSAGSSPNIHC